MMSPVAADLHPAGIVELCRRERFGHTVLLLEAVSSTNTAASSAAAAGVPEGTAIIAARQTAGRGRAGREWFSSATGALVFSLVTRPQRPSGSVTAVLALAAAEALEKRVEGVAIKWPNDIMIGGRKIAGILAEAGAGAVTLGMGINVNEDAQAFPEALRLEAVSLRMLTGTSIRRGTLLVDLLKRLGSVYADWERGGFESLRPRVERRLLWRGEKVRLGSGTEAVEGFLLGLTTDGRLRLSRPDGELVIAAGDVAIVRGFYPRRENRERKDAGS